MKGLSNLFSQPSLPEVSKNLRAKLTQCQQSDDEFIPVNFDLNKNQNKIKRKRKSRETYKLWDIQENKIFLDYLQFNRSSFESLLSRRSNKVFVSMSKIFSDRNSHQCKSHYQKLQKMAKDDSVGQVIKYLQKFLKKKKVLRQKSVKMMAKVNLKTMQKTTQVQAYKQSIFVIKQKVFEIRLILNSCLLPIW